MASPAPAVAEAETLCNRYGYTYFDLNPWSDTRCVDLTAKNATQCRPTGSCISSSCESHCYNADPQGSCSGTDGIFTKVGPVSSLFLIVSLGVAHLHLLRRDHLSLRPHYLPVLHRPQGGVPRPLRYELVSEEVLAL